ncbi:hypothetical protein [Paenibacillus ihumii]|uniref:hypothetical protein n=1 Tax=Paenibacillus ihumii TaxID=687436 RepID=UPI0006D7656A|nr:hypothetical protein [Paenibacillus ihumii]
MGRIEDEIAELRERVARLEERTKLYEEPSPRFMNYVRWFLAGFLTVAGLMTLWLVAMVVIQYVF